MSSVITIVGTKLATKRPDKRHPWATGASSTSSTVISVLVLYAGVTSLVESVKGIAFPQTPDCTPVSLVIVAAAVVVKLLLGRHVKATGRRVDSDSPGGLRRGRAVRRGAVALHASRSAGLHRHGRRDRARVGRRDIRRDRQSGLEMLGGTLSQSWANARTRKISSKVKALVEADPDAHGAYGLLLHAYRPEHLVGSVHTEVPDTMTAAWSTR